MGLQFGMNGQIVMVILVLFMVTNGEIGIVKIISNIVKIYIIMIQMKKN